MSNLAAEFKRVREALDGAIQFALLAEAPDEVVNHAREDLRGAIASLRAIGEAQRHDELCVEVRMEFRNVKREEYWNLMHGRPFVCNCPRAEIMEVLK